MSRKLRACPRCGGKPIITGGYKLAGPWHRRWYIICNNCVRSTNGHLMMFRAIDEWNRDDQSLYM